MKYFIILLALSFGAEFALAKDEQFCNQFELAFYQAVNQHRAKLGLKTVSLNLKANDIMRQHVQAASKHDLSQLDNNPKLRKSIAHQNIESRRLAFDELVRQLGKYRTNGGEISYLGFYPSLSPDESAQEALRQFLASPSHKNIIEGSYNEGSLFGLASIFKDGRIIISAYFIGVA